MAINVEGQYYLQVNLEDKKDFIFSENLSHFIIQEDSGNALPVWELGFVTKDENILENFNEGSILKVIYGNNKDKLESSLYVTTFEICKDRFPFIEVFMEGSVGNIKYIDGSNRRIFKSKTAYDVLKSVSSSYFHWDKNNITSTKDTQNWIQAGISDRQFITDTWLHSYVSSSFSCCAITADGRFIFKDMKKNLKNGYKWKFVRIKSETNMKDNEIFYSKYLLRSDASLNNKVIGNKRKFLQENVESGTGTFVYNNPSNLISNNTYLPRSSNLDYKNIRLKPLNNNVHANYNSTYYNNLANNIVLSSNCVMLSFFGSLKFIDVLDYVYIDAESLDGTKTSKFESGGYIVGSINKNFTGNTLQTTVYCYREGLNDQRGALA